MNLAIHMLTYNGATAFIREAIGSVYAWSNEIRVYDTGSTDNTVDLIRKEFPRVILSEYPIQHLGQTWTESAKDIELTRLLNQLIDETAADWILKIDDDEIFPNGLMKEIMNIEDEILIQKSPIYSIPFLHVGGKEYRHHLIKRLFKKCTEVRWKGIYGNESLALNGARVRSHKVPMLMNNFYHLGGLSPFIDNRQHDYSSL